MQFPESWLREFCNPPLSTQQLADTLTMAGLEVEELQPVAPPFDKVVVGEIKDAVQHPNADRLRVCQVDAGQGSLLQIVCGAPNARVGIKVPVALVGAELPPGEDGKTFAIKAAKLRSVDSAGMLCSARELKLSDDHGGLLELSADAPIGQNIREHLRLDDTLFTLKLTPNLAHCLSVYGIARELSALTGAPLTAPAFPAVPVQLPATDRMPVKISAPDLCGRFSGRIVRGVNTKAQTPAWMVERLARCGQRSVCQRSPCGVTGHHQPAAGRLPRRIRRLLVRRDPEPRLPAPVAPAARDRRRAGAGEPVHERRGASAADAGAA